MHTFPRSPNLLQLDVVAHATPSAPSRALKTSPGVVLRRAHRRDAGADARAFALGGSTLRRETTPKTTGDARCDVVETEIAE
jgi:hypothetical protein